MAAENILSQAQQHVQQLYAHHHKPYLIYHNLTHTTQVAIHVAELCIWHQVNRLETYILSAAAWFHDTGHLFTEPSGHEVKSVEIMRAYFLGCGLHTDLIDAVAACIMATKAPWQPQNLLQEIICDADTYHLGTRDFWNTNCSVWMEDEARQGKAIPDWKLKSIAFLEKHHFFTLYCRQLLDPVKRANLQHLKDRINDGKGPCIEKLM